MRGGGTIIRALAAAALVFTGIAQAQMPAAAPFEPVTDAMIQRPDPKDWLSWRRTLDLWGYSPLAEIDRTNVSQLRMVWARPLADGHQEGTPLVHNGVLYFPGPSDNIQAIDAASGDVLWQHRRELPKDVGDYLPFPETNRNLALYGNLVIARGTDDVIYAVDAETGKTAWETTILDYRKGAKQSSGPIIADGLAITGRSCEPEGGPDACVITAHDARTGKEVWRTSVIARDGDPNSKSWGKVPLADRQQVGAWMIASYDPELKLLYMGTSVTAPAPKIALDGNDKDYLYHNSTLALDVKTGKIVWYYQHLLDHWDLDHTFPRMLIDQQVAPDPSEVTWINPKIDRKKIYKVLTGVPGKTGIVYTLDRQTGTFLWARPTIYQNVVQSIDGRTGKVTGNPETVFNKFGEEKTVCPSAAGGANYPSPAYSPLTKTMYLTAQNTCFDITALPPGPDAGTYAFAATHYIAPSANGNLGSIHAVDTVTGKTKWTRQQRAGTQSLMTTGGGLVFMGDVAGRFRALDQETGAVLWEVNLGSSVTGYPVTFEVDGHQYVAVSTGRWLNDSFTPEVTHGTQNTLYVFALPAAGTGKHGPAKAPIDAASFSATDAALAGAAKPSRSVTQGVFAAAQARAGQAVYVAHCATCHGADFNPGPGAKQVAGSAFRTTWKGRNVGDLYALIRTTMPPGGGGSLPDADYLAVTAYLLEANGWPAGRELPRDAAALREIGIP
jgi:alcohol dehydrogenase (cytochrome c)